MRLLLRVMRRRSELLLLLVRSRGRSTPLLLLRMVLLLLLLRRRRVGLTLSSLFLFASFCLLFSTLSSVPLLVATTCLVAHAAVWTWSSHGPRLGLKWLLWSWVALHGRFRRRRVAHCSVPDSKWRVTR